VVLDTDEVIAAQLRVPADRRQTDQLLTWANQWPERIWAAENSNGLAVCWPTSSSLAVRSWLTCCDVVGSHATALCALGRKSDEFDARSVAIVAVG
jgi:hypothetical protein